MFDIEKEDIALCSNQLLRLVKGFDKQHPNLNNLRKFGKLNL
jgi:hypothetical protein